MLGLSSFLTLPALALLEHSPLVQSASAVGCTTQARNLLVFDGEFVVVGNFLIHIYVSLGVDDYLLLGFYCHNLCIAVGL